MLQTGCSQVRGGRLPGIAEIMLTMQVRCSLDSAIRNQQSAIRIRLRRALSICCLLLISNSVVAAPCTSLKLNPDGWVAAKTDALILNARKLFDDDDAAPAYNRVVDGIARTINQCKLRDNETFARRYPEFLRYI